MKYDNCVRCKDRIIGCHSNCEYYKKYKQEMEKIRQNKKMERLINPKYKTRRSKKDGK